MIERVPYRPKCHANAQFPQVCLDLMGADGKLVRIQNVLNIPETLTPIDFLAHLTHSIGYSSKVKKYLSFAAPSSGKREAVFNW
jgi:hypothetical protein